MRPIDRFTEKIRGRTVVEVHSTRNPRTKRILRAKTYRKNIHLLG